jgi:hypothetical protein
MGVESVCRLPRRAATFSPVDPIWVFSARGLFVTKTPVRRYWIRLDFLGFSRPNLDLSMSYTGFSLAEISRALGLANGSAGMDSTRRGRADAQDCSWGKLNIISDFLQ